MNNSLQEINKRNLDIELAAKLWDVYTANASHNLETSGDKTDPI